ncbi:DNA polymerase I [Oceanibaculum pacificum]|uniref:DNA polymerase I n=1 Tax=Oceanibaculum pacificum TaxID=580166 RepID=A0A154WFH9_9PROT|nr:DNA polymerase I [Oceanibaculum pacificum]KZD12270.1 DNA polymerase I [Oceanibaculum pacificum]
MSDAPLDTPAARNALYLVDGSGYIFRAYHALPPMTRADGTPVNAVFGFSAMLMKLVEEIDAQHLAVIFDSARETFRNEIYPAYKAQRPEPPEDLRPQFALIRDAVRAFNVPCIEMPGFEADDLIATYARHARKQGMEVVIVSSDKDLMQLVGDGVTMLDPIKNKPIGPAEVMEKFGVPPAKVVDVQSLAGDSVDNVPGVPGIGVKTAAQLIEEYGDLESLLARASEIKQPKRRESLIEYAEQARISRELVKLRDDVPLEVPVNGLEVRDPEHATLLAFFEENNFKRLVARLTALEAMAGHGGNQPPAGGSAPANPQAAELAPAQKSYETVVEEADLVRWIAAATEAGCVSVDTETTGLNPMSAELVGVSLSLEAGRACYVPLAHGATPVGQGSLLDAPPARPKQIDKQRALALLKPMLEDPSVLKVGHNMKYDWVMFRRQGIDVAPIDDSMLISYVLEGGAHGHGMDELSELHLGHKTITFKEIAGSGKDQVTFDQVPLDRATDYAAEDADVTGRLHRLLKPRLRESGLLTFYETIERPLVPIIGQMEREGIKVDREVLAEMSTDFARRMGEYEIEIYKLAGREFNIGSPKQLGEILFDEIGLQGGKKGKTGAYATGADILESLAVQHELPARILEWRQIAKLKSTYADALVGQINPETGRVHTCFAMAATSTGRLSSSDPNVQNIPIRTEEGRRIRRAFIAEKGHKLLSVDYSQVELRIVADIGGLEALRQAFRDGIDIHAMTASQVFGVPLDQMDPMTRRKAKAINFGIIYGISGFGLARQLGVEPGEAAAYIRAYFERYPGIRDYMDKAKEEARRQGFVRTLFGRQCHVPGIADKNPARRAFAERQAINAPIQGTAADIIKRAMIRIPAALAQAGLSARMLLQVHDELLFEVPEAELDATSALVREVMEGATRPVLDLAVPLVAEAGVGDSWDQAH